MTTIASQITSLMSVYSTVYSDADQSKHQSSESLAFVWGIHRDRWILRTKGQLRGKCFHLMTSSCSAITFFDNFARSTRKANASGRHRLPLGWKFAIMITRVLLSVKHSWQVLTESKPWFMKYQFTACVNIGFFQRYKLHLHIGGIVLFAMPSIDSKSHDLCARFSLRCVVLWFSMQWTCLDVLFIRSILRWKKNTSASAPFRFFSSTKI